jgi:hypothetical protein
LGEVEIAETTAKTRSVEAEKSFESDSFALKVSKRTRKDPVESAETTAKTRSVEAEKSFEFSFALKVSKRTRKDPMCGAMPRTLYRSAAVRI